MDTPKEPYLRNLSGGGYSFDSAYCYSELSEGDKGNIICTGFINRKMPFIRYELDDTAEKEFDYYRIIGHREGLLLGRDNVQISAAAMEVHSDILSKVANYQFVQSEIGTFEVRIIPVNTITDSDKTALQNLFQNRVGKSFNVKIKIVEELELTQRGKYKLLIQNIK